MSNTESIENTAKHSSVTSWTGDAFPAYGVSPVPTTALGGAANPWALPSQPIEDPDEDKYVEFDEEFPPGSDEGISEGCLCPPQDQIIAEHTGLYRVVEGCDMHNARFEAASPKSKPAQDSSNHDFVRWLILDESSPYNELGMEVSKALNPGFMDITALLNNFVDRATGNGDAPPTEKAWQDLAKKVEMAHLTAVEDSPDKSMANIIIEVSNFFLEKERPEVVKSILDLAFKLYGNTGLLGAEEVIRRRIKDSMNG